MMTPPSEHASEGGRDDRGVPYHAESTLSSAQVLQIEFDTLEHRREANRCVSPHLSLRPRALLIASFRQKSFWVL